jgi:hypothetical protein
MRKNKENQAVDFIDVRVVESVTEWAGYDTLEELSCIGDYCDVIDQLQRANTDLY